MTLIIDCLVDNGILIGADCKKTDDKNNFIGKTQKIFPFQSKDKISFIYTASGLLCIDQQETCKMFSTNLRLSNVTSCLKQLAFDNLKSFTNNNFLFNSSDGCGLMLYYFDKNIPFQSQFLFNYKSKYQKKVTNKLLHGFIGSNLVGKNSERFYQLISENLQYFQLLKYSFLTKEPISYKNGQEIVQWTLENYIHHYPDQLTGSGIQLGILKPAEFEWIRKDFEK